jgi:hypothetical protein
VIDRSSLVWTLGVAGMSSAAGEFRRVSINDVLCVVAAVVHIDRSGWILIERRSWYGIQLAAVSYATGCMKPSRPSAVLYCCARLSPTIPAPARERETAPAKLSQT